VEPLPLRIRDAESHGLDALRIGPHRLHLPVVAINRVERPCAEPSFWPCGYGDQELAGSAIQGPALPVSGITVTLSGYSIFQDTARDELIAIPELCGKLQQRWARRQCSGADLFPDHLRRFTLIGPSALAQTNSLGTINDARPGPLRRQATAIRAFLAHAAVEREADERLIKALNRPG